MHWADQIAEKVIEERGKELTVASGITPSGSIHIGNFREEITVELVARALRDQGADVRYIHSWDDFDAFRKVPGNVPDEWEEYLGMPHSKVPDPWDCHDSYAEHFEEEFEDVAPELHVEPEFIYQTEMYMDCAYADLIKEALEQREKVIEILNRFRKEPRPDDWIPLDVFCPDCWYQAEVLSYGGEYTVTYECHECGEEGDLDFSQDGYVKPRWRVDWPMRWKYEDVAFEPGGKEHSTPGGSRTTAKLLVREIFDGEPPIYQMYDFITLKGAGGKMSGSEGNVITPAELLEVMGPAVVRYLYAGTKPVKEFAVALDEEIVKTQEDYYRAERIYFGEEEDPNEEHWERVYELSKIEVPEEMPPQINYGFLARLGQIYEGDEALERLREMGHVDELTSAQEEYLLGLMGKAAAWAREYGGEKYRMEIQDEVPAEVGEELTDGQREAMEELAAELEGGMDREEIQSLVYGLDETAGGTAEAFQAVYLCLLGRESGPRAGELIETIGPERVKKILGTLD